MFYKNDETRKSSMSDKSMDQDDDDDKETKYRLDPKWISRPHDFLHYYDMF